ncbi:tRNA threonylcarbamoyladenosine dehydratase [Fusobacterium gastrosuis]|uniref:tRNA threonylcarbamoyladenosine dehydratase n=1 Tax=Fusobacterium gastrosuis TaxID=1755100 RepID=UPI002974D694|nr:tRNA threonylcarbamoyladenosine dehydratase [Fusobacteriaceae bacterium]MDY5713006.1 tRNA threonylcarbamoyladenosine dehydratase [Fusobacterium gastrosuis]
MIFQRTELAIGLENLEKLQKSHIIVFGLGGVGGGAVEALVRSGIGELSLVDFDTVDITNLNRQLIATQNTIGQHKALAMKERALSINPDITINTYIHKFLKEDTDLFFKDKKYDYVIDAIDLITPKLDLIEFCYKQKIPIISSMGTGNKLDPTQFQVADINKTSVCPMAKVIRKELKKRNVKKLKVVFSKECPRKPVNEDGSREKRHNVGSIAFVPPVVGMILASQVIKDICKL